LHLVLSLFCIPTSQKVLRAQVIAQNTFHACDDGAYDSNEAIGIGASLKATLSSLELEVASLRCTATQLEELNGKLAGEKEELQQLNGKLAVEKEELELLNGKLAEEKEELQQLVGRAHAT
jgi:hypothetical protein